MKGLETYFVPWLISNIAGLLILWTAYKKPKIARVLFVLLFGWAGWINFTTAHSTPSVYLEYASMSFSVYSRFIEGWFSEHVTIMVSIIALGQVLIAVGMVLKGWWVKLAAAGAILFLLAIAPLGVGAGFPFSLTVIIAAWLIIRRNDHDYLWGLKKSINLG